ncbi:MarR family winged helix-turn-helix transcriptional regulator [Streptomyces sp. G5(2025)]|uniref:MarR family winged helix-turn-helix transcriptional regulator n=1 Tax=Streptomyces sp. G5(2025) TaxID=3406628 RepID=UPI003C1F39F4
MGRYQEEYEEAAAEHALTARRRAPRLIGLLFLEPMPMRRIAQKLKIAQKSKCEPSNITGIVDRLEARGLVERRSDPADRRVKPAAPTSEGAEVARGWRGSPSFACEPLAELAREERLSLRGPLREMLGGEA